MTTAFLRRHLRQHLDVLVGMRKFVLQAGDLLAQLIDQFDFRVDILRWLIRNEAGFHGVVERRQVLFNVLVGGRQAGDHQRVGVTA